jgi:hypothetical protein
MRIILAIAVVFVVIGVTAVSAQAEINPADYSPAKILLTLHQERLLMHAVESHHDALVLPLTEQQKVTLEKQWRGWSSSVLTVYPADMLDSDGSIYVVP